LLTRHRRQFLFWRLTDTVIASAAKQSIFLCFVKVDCFAALAMTLMDFAASSTLRLLRQINHPVPEEGALAIVTERWDGMWWTRRYRARDGIAGRASRPVSGHRTG
jgi:hypothetical protein